jgi:Holliday junction resolvase
MSGKKSRNKGKRGELELAKKLKSLFNVSARRGRQYSGSPESPDVVTSIKGVHFECKRVERLQLYPSLEQAANDSGDDQIPIVAYRKNRKEWVAIVYLDDLPELCEKLNKK